MLAFLEITRTAFVSVLRRLGPWLLGVAVGLGAWRWAERSLGEVFLLLGIALLIGVVVPLFAGGGVRRWLHGGPLGLTTPGAAYGATVGYGLGTAMVAAPAVAFLSWLGHPGDVEPTLFVLLPTTLAAAWLGAAAGRIAEAPVAIVTWSWLGGGLAGAASAIVYGQLDLPRSVLAGYGDLVEFGGLLLLAIQVLLVGASFLDKRTAASSER